ncbi:FUSC family protein [Aromatoleum sp.]|uniref:FUSC family protein n=1 Tax=Aromatoleum sp. TaxID=2307007 RepID=UPI002FCB8DC4
MTSFRSFRELVGFEPEIVRKALSLAFAAWLSFAIASLLHVHNAYWAAMPVWVLTQASRGLVVERAVFRIVGTLIGASVGFALVHVPAPPIVQLALLAGWIGFNAALTHLLRGVHGYGALLAGMTAAVVVIPALLTPTESLDIAIARVECTLIGVVVSTLVLAVLTPVSPLAEFYAQVRAVSADAVAYAARLLRDPAAAGDAAEEGRLVAQISQLDASARPTAAGSVEGYRRLGDIDLLVVGSLSTIAAAQAVKDAGCRIEPGLPEWLDRVAARLRRESQAEAREAGWAEADDDVAVARLKIAVGQILDAGDALAHGVSRPVSGATRIRLAPHREWALAGRTAALAAAASFGAGLVGLAWPWPAVELAALGVCIFVMVLGSLPLPQLVAPKLFAGVVTGVVAATFYRLALQPHIASNAALLLSIAPFVLLGGFGRANPRTGIAAIDANMCFMLASQAGMPAVDDVGRVLADSAALAVAAGLMAGLFVLLPRRAQRQAFDAAAVIRRDLQRILEADAGDRLAWHARASRAILRLTLHLGRAKTLGERWPAGLVATLNLGHALIDLRKHGMPESVRTLLASMLQQKRTPRQTVTALDTLAGGIDDAGTRRQLGRLSLALDRAADLLTFGLAAPASHER